MDKIIIIGSTNCGKCHITKKLLIDKGFEFEYKNLNELTKEEIAQFVDKAREEGKMALPIIYKNDTIVELQTLLQG